MSLVCILANAGCNVESSGEVDESLKILDSTLLPAGFIKGTEAPTSTLCRLSHGRRGTSPPEGQASGKEFRALGSVISAYPRKIQNEGFSRDKCSWLGPGYCSAVPP